MIFHPILVIPIVLLAGWPAFVVMNCVDKWLPAYGWRADLATISITLFIELVYFGAIGALALLIWNQSK